MNESKNVPKIRFEGFKEDWKKGKLISLCERFTDGDWIELKDQSNSGVRLIQTGNIGIGLYLEKEDTKKWVSMETFEMLNCEEVFEGDILISRLPEPAGRACIVPQSNTKMITAVDCTIVRVLDNINNKYLIQCLSSKKYFNEVNLCLAGGTRQRISRNNLGNIEIHRPALYKEQEKIGNYFENLDSLISLQNQKYEKLLNLKKSLLYKLFPKEGKTVPELRFEGFSGKWEKKKLGEVLTYRNGKAHEKNIVTKGKFIVVNSKFVSTKGAFVKFSNIQIQPLYKNEIVFVLSDVPNGKAIAKTFLIDIDNVYTLNQRIAGLKVTEAFNPYFVYLLLNKNEYFLKFDDGVNQTNLSKKDVIEFETFYPNINEQTLIGQYFSKLDKLIELNKEKLEKLKNVKESLLDKMFV